MCAGARAKLAHGVLNMALDRIRRQEETLRHLGGLRTGPLTRRQAGADVDLIHHSDAGSQYTSYAFNEVLDDHQVLASIGTVGDAFDTQSRFSHSMSFGSV